MFDKRGNKNDIYSNEISLSARNGNPAPTTGHGARVAGDSGSEKRTKVYIGAAT